MTWTQFKAVIGLGGVCVTGALAAILGGWDMWLKALVLFVILDYLTGVLAAATQKKLNSQVGYKGIIKKVFIFILVAVAFELDILLGTSAIRIAVIGFYLGTEGLSILENAGKAGIPLPEPLMQALIQIRGEDKWQQKNI